jgi:hypothetical protein
MLKKFYFALVLAALPVFTFAQISTGKLEGTKGILEGAYGIVKDVLVPLAFTLALLYFFYGVAKYIWSEGAGKAEGKSIMIWGVVALFVMASIWGIISFIQSEVGIDVAGQNKAIIPGIQYSPN